jgi:hypothetical protein
LNVFDLYASLVRLSEWVGILSKSINRPPPLHMLTVPRVFVERGMVGPVLPLVKVIFKKTLSIFSAAKSFGCGDFRSFGCTAIAIGCCGIDDMFRTVVGRGSFSDVQEGNKNPAKVVRSRRSVWEHLLCYRVSIVASF